MKQLDRESEAEGFAAAEIPPGPNAGRVFCDPLRRRRDAVSGRLVRQLTNYRGHSHHSAGGEPCWLEGGRRLVVVSDRDGCGNLFVFDFAGETLTQLTDLRGVERPWRPRLMAEARLGFCYGASSYILELATLRIRTVVPGFLDASNRIMARLRTTGDEPLADGRRAIWIGDGVGDARESRVVAVTEGSGRAPFALTAACLRPGGTQVVFASDAGGYTQIYAVGVGRREILPRLADLQPDETGSAIPRHAVRFGAAGSRSRLPISRAASDLPPTRPPG